MNWTILIPMILNIFGAASIDDAQIPDGTSIEIGHLRTQLPGGEQPPQGYVPDQRKVTWGELKRLFGGEG